MNSLGVDLTENLLKKPAVEPAPEASNKGIGANSVVCKTMPEVGMKRHLSHSDSMDSLSSDESPATKVARVTEAMGQMSLNDVVPPWSELDFDTFYVESAEDFDRLIDYCQEQCPGVPVHLVQQLSDFDDSGLISDIRINDSDQPGAADLPREQEVPGALFSDQPSILLLDCRNMRTANLAEMNKLLDTQPRFGDRPLGRGCKRVVLINRDMQSDTGKKNTDKARGDFWRRISRSTNSWDIPAAGSKVVQQPAQVPGEWLPERHVPHCTVDFQYAPDWRAQLFGTCHLNEQGQAVFLPGELEKLARQDGTEAGTVILKGAPRDNPGFALAIRQIQSAGGFTANGHFISTRHLTFVYQPEDPGVIGQLLQSVQYTPAPDPGYFCINCSDFDDCLSEGALEGSTFRRHDLLADILQHSPGLRISSGLSKEQWVQLLRKIHQIRPGQPPSRYLWMLQRLSRNNSSQVSRPGRRR